MKTFVAMIVLWFLYSLTACSSGDPGTGEFGSSLPNQTSSSSGNYQIGPDCYDMDGASCAAFKATNVQRIVNGVPALAYCKICNLMAEEQSQDMNDRGYFDHQRPDETFAQRATRFGIGKGAGENIALGKIGDEVVVLWMNSPGHKANILNPTFKSFAVGTYNLYSTQVFYVDTDK
jgi:uncharacterized protein YkwD